MRNFKVLFLMIFVTLVLANCSKDDGEDIVYYSTLGIISEQNDSTFIESDGGKRMFIVNPSLGSDIKEGDRVFAYFTIVDKTLPAGVDYIIDVYSIEEVLFKAIFEYDSTNSDSIGNDEITVNAIEIAKDYLNLNFSFLGGQNKHYINLARPKGEFATDTVELEIRHNDNNDLGINWINAFVSFDLTSIQNNVADSVILRIKANGYDNDSYQKILTYKY